MQLPDFLDFEPFNELRDTMGADKLGYFEVFDPKHHLTGEERAELRLNGVPVVRSQIQFLGDHTLAYKNSRIGLVVDGTLHVTRCRELDDFESGLAVGSQDAAEVEEVKACPQCLHQLRFDGLDLDKERKHHHNIRTLREFDLARFYAIYPDYPLYERTHVRHPF